MDVKFVMFPSGVAFFSEIIRHDDFRVTDKTGKEERPVSAGCLYVGNGGNLETFSLSGRSINLGLDHRTSYSDWRDRYTSSGLPIVCRVYDFGPSVQAFFFPFAEGSEFNARGVGRASPPQVVTLQEVIAYAGKLARM